MVLLSKSEKDFISRGILEDLRADGRGRLDYRPVNLSVDVIPQSIGSARLKLGGGGDLIVAIRAEISRPADPEHSTIGTLNCSIDYSSLVVSDEKGSHDRNNLMATALQRILSSSFDLHQLCIVKGKHCWALFVDVLIVEEDGNVLDAAVMAARAALLSTRLPGVSVEEDTEAESLELSSDPSDAKALQCSDLPFLVTLCQIDSINYFVDPTKAEEACALATLSVAVNPAGSICFIQKSSGGSIDLSIFNDMIGVAQSTAASLFSQFQ